MIEPSLRAQGVLAWPLGDGRRIAEPNAFLEALAPQLLGAGVPVHPHNHRGADPAPQSWSYSGLWEAGLAPASAVTASVRPMWPRAWKTARSRSSTRGGRPGSLRPATPERRPLFPILADLRQAGITDYIVLGARFSDGSAKAVSLPTNHAQRFSENDISVFEAMVPALAMNLEIQTLRRTARTLLDTYVGRQSGGRMLDGAITRGIGETIYAVI